MQRTLLEFPLTLDSLGELLALDRATGAVHQWKLNPLLGPLRARPGFRLRLVVLEEPKNPGVSDIPDERVVECARERLRCHLVRTCFATGYTEHELRDLSDAIEDLVAARIGRALRIHCDADHSDEC